MPPSYLGEFEQIVLLALLRTADNAYGMRIRKEIMERTGRDVSIGAVYATLDRLEAKEMVTSSRQGADDDTRGGHPRRHFQITAQGLEALKTSQQALARLNEGLNLEAPTA